jgi:hypothetical protein
MAKKEDKNKNQDHFQIIEFGGKVLSVNRRSACWTEDMGADGNVEIKVDSKTGKKTATCKTCGKKFTWGGNE